MLMTNLSRVECFAQWPFAVDSFGEEKEMFKKLEMM